MLCLLDQACCSPRIGQEALLDEMSATDEPESSGESLEETL